MYSRQVVCEKLILFNLLVDTCLGCTRELSNLALKAASFFMSTRRGVDENQLAILTPPSLHH